MDRKLFESSFQNTKDHIQKPYQTLRKGSEVKTCPVDPLIANSTKWILFKPSHEAHLTMVSLALEEA
ncbi:unnamed protein product [Arabis nemorensis]|uniref:Uncharacterized protein n=1 Tax=Arabis nemorensis TaxID=586526 RepID=A0A565B6K1_9BRAS|nr:unnamed protein product [Arabis nemorensis]